MKKSILLILLSVFLANANELDWVEEQVKAIKPPRVGISLNDISKLKDPFIFIKKEVKKDKTKKTIIKNGKKQTIVVNQNQKPKKKKGYLVLEATMNKSALINGKWYKQGSKVGIFKLKKVNLTSVVLVKGRKKVILSTRIKNKKLKFHK